MSGRRGGRVQVNMLQYLELVERIDRLESLVLKVGKEEESDLTKKEIMEQLDALSISYNARSRREELLSLLPEEE